MDLGPLNAIRGPGSYGGFWSGLKDFFMGGDDKFQQMPRMEPQQQEAMNQLLQNILPQLLSGDASQGFEPIAESARMGFAQDTMPSIMERFTGMNLGGGRSSGGLEALGEAGRRMETDLGAQRAQYGLQRQGQLANLLNMAMAPQQENFFMPGKTGFLQAMAPGIGQGLGMWATGGLGGLLGMGGQQQQQQIAPGSVTARR